MGTGDRHVDAAQAQGTHHGGIGPPLTGDVLWAGGKSGICCCFQEDARALCPTEPTCTSPALSITEGDREHHSWGTSLSEDTRAELCPDPHALPVSGGIPV